MKENITKNNQHEIVEIVPSKFIAIIDKESANLHIYTAIDDNGEAVGDRDTFYDIDGDCRKYLNENPGIKMVGVYKLVRLFRRGGIEIISE